MYPTKDIKISQNLQESTAESFFRVLQLFQESEFGETFKSTFLHRAHLVAASVNPWCPIRLKKILTSPSYYSFNIVYFRQNQPLEVFYKKGVLWNFAKFTGKHLCLSLFIKKETLAQVFSCEFCEISKNTYSTEHIQTTASILLFYLSFRLHWQ